MEGFIGSTGSQCSFLISLNSFLRVVRRWSPKNTRLMMEEDLWICEILCLPTIMFLNDFWLERIPEMIVTAREIRSPMFMKRSTVLLRLYFPLNIALK